MRGKYACKDCENGVTTVENPMQPIEKGLAGPGLLAHVVTSKYSDHLPLNRQEDIFERHGIKIARSTMCDWMRQVAELLTPLYEMMKKHVLQSMVIHTDDTPVSVLDPQMSKSRTGRMWVYWGDKDNPYSVFDYTPTRRRDGPERFLGDYTGYLHADAYGGYDGIYATRDIIEVACWAHARRKYAEAQSTSPKEAATALGWIGMLYKIEKDIKESSAEDRFKRRQEEALPRLGEFHRWPEECSTQVLPKGPMGQAIRYTLSNWKALIRYLDNGNLAIDNNAAERAVRPIAVGRKNWLFAGSDTGGETAAVLFSFTSTCKRQGIDPFVYLRDVITRISAHPAKKLFELLPDRWKRGQESLLSIPA